MTVKTRKTRPDKQLKWLCLILFCLLLSTASIAAPLKPRLVVLTDISTWEPDDHESLIRLLVHADMYEIEGLVYTTGWSISDAEEHKGFMDIIYGVIDAYENDLPNLLKRSDQSGHDQDNVRQEIGYWPSPDYLRDRTVMGSTNRGMKFIGASNNSAGSNLIIDLADEKDDRPLWVTIWGGGNTLAQAIWQVQNTRSEEELETFLHKIRAYAITDQDRHYNGSEGYEVSSHQWMRREFADDLLFIWDECAWKFQNGTGRKNWSQYETHIQNHGDLGAQYPKYKFGVEGDTPAFLHVMPNGLNNPDDPTQCSWGGYSEKGLGADSLTYAFTNHAGEANRICNQYENHFYPATFNNFAARMDWAENGAGNRNPVVLINENKGISILQKTPRPGTTVTLDASETFDPDNDDLTFHWWVQPEAGTYSKTITISNSDSSIATVNVPSDSEGKTFHVICEVTDDGTHNLSSYRRIIFEPTRPASMGKNSSKLRVIISSDFPPLDVCNGNDCKCAPSRCSDPDDVQSMVRFLLYANEFDIEALIASSATFANYAEKQHILDIINLYDQVDENLRKHDSDYPSPDALREVTFQGRSGTWGKSIDHNIGAGKDSEASKAIIRIVDKPDPRPVYICVWGDCSNIAQAIWTVQQTRSAAELEAFLSKLRIHQISHQDDTIDWLLENFPDLFIIYSKKTYQGMFGGSDPISNLEWVNTNIRTNHGPLGAAYPPAGMACDGVCEGDSPSFLWLVSANRGLNDPDNPTQPSWGGQFQRDGDTNHFIDGIGGSSISKWRPYYQAEFKERADWMLP